MLYREIIGVCSQIHTKHINTLCGQNAEFVNVTATGTHHHHTESPRRTNTIEWTVLLTVARHSSKSECFMDPEGSQNLATWDWWITLRCVTLDVAASRSYPMAGFVMDGTETDACVETEHLEHNINVSYCCRFTRTTRDLDSVCKAPQTVWQSCGESKQVLSIQYVYRCALVTISDVWLTVHLNSVWVRKTN